MSELEITVEAPCYKECEEIIKEFWPELKKAIKNYLPDSFFLEVSFVGNETIKELNGNFRGKDTATDVLSFEDGDILPDGSVFLGSIVISCERAKTQAEEIGNLFNEEIRFLFLHGVLHLLGFDHETDNGEMFDIQKNLKRRLKTFFSHTED